jgi:hypothetical protein
MDQRGRKSVSSMSIASPVQEIRRHAPPEGLSDLETEIWVMVVDALPADWFGRDQLPLLLAYCKHAARAQLLDQEIDEFDPKWLKDDDGLKRYDKLLGMRERETRQITTLARSMRITQQSRTHKDKAGSMARKGGGGKPWHDQ